MMVLLDGEPSGKVGSLCKRFLRAFTLLFTSVCKMWVRISPSGLGIEGAPFWSGVLGREGEWYGSTTNNFHLKELLFSAIL
jgi:hypothetical protein